jgi:uncharacterized integral membrane protein
MARKLVFFFGIALLGVAGAVLVADIATAVESGGFHPVSLGGLLFALSRVAIERIRVIVQGHVSAVLWDGAVAPILRLPAALVFGLPGLLLVMAARRWRRTVDGGGQAEA